MNAYEIIHRFDLQEPIDENVFEQLMQEFENSYLEGIDFKNNIEIHRFPDNYRNEVVHGIYDYLQKIGHRDEMRDNHDGWGSYVPNTLKDIWERDKRVNTIYARIERFCTLRSRDFNSVAVHVAEYEALSKLAEKIRQNIYPNNHAMQKTFEIEMRETFEKPYLKVFLKADADFSMIAKQLESLHSVRRANVTDQKSGKKDLTIYPEKAYDMKEVEQEVTLALDNHFKGNPIDPTFLKEKISAISDKAYFQILDHILLLGKNLEAFKDLNTRFDEERYRDYFIPFLNSISESHAAKGEVFNHSGKTDILVFDTEGNNVFIAECKLWKGEAYLRQAIDQLLNNYVNWRDEKVALIVFNRDIKKFSDVIDKALQVVDSHPCHLKSLGVRKDTSYSFIFHHPDDQNKIINLELLLLNFS